MRQEERLPSDHELRTLGKSQCAEEASDNLLGVRLVSNAGRAIIRLPMRQWQLLPSRKP